MRDFLRKNSIAEKMDLHNNKIGLQIGRYNNTRSIQYISDICFKTIEKNGIWLK